MPDIYVAEKEKREKEKHEVEEKTEGELDSILSQKTTNPLSSFAPNPLGFKFETQDKGERIIFLLRKHWITNLPWILAAILGFFAPLVLYLFPLISFLPTRFQLIMIILWYCLLITFIFENFLSWFFNVYIITDERIVDVDFYSLIYKQITEAKIDKIQDITLRQGGVVRIIFGFGDVLIQTAGAQPNLEFEAVPNPERVMKILQELRLQEEIEAIEGRVR
jgi:hypothetical protein